MFLVFTVGVLRCQLFLALDQAFTSGKEIKLLKSQRGTENQVGIDSLLDSGSARQPISGKENQQACWLAVFLLFLLQI